MVAASHSDLGRAALSVRSSAASPAIAASPDILFFDEPTTGLDPIMGAVIDGLITEQEERLSNDPDKRDY